MLDALAKYHLRVREETRTLDRMPTPRLVTLIDGYKHAHGVPDAELARRIGISRQNLSLWRTTGFRALPARANLDAVAAVIDRPYREVLEAALWDSGYADTTTDAPRPAYDEVLADAVRIFTVAARLTTSRVHQTAAGRWEFVDGVRDPIDWAEFVCAALAGAAANAGGIDAVLAGRPGSWEAARIRDTLHSTVGDDFAELMRHRTEPVDIVVHPERILFDRDDSTWFDDYDSANADLDDRGADDDLQLARGETIHDGVFFVGAHAAVDEAHAERFQRAVDQRFEGLVDTGDV